MIKKEVTLFKLKTHKFIKLKIKKDKKLSIIIISTVY